MGLTLSGHINSLRINLHKKISSIRLIPGFYAQWGFTGIGGEMTFKQACGKAMKPLYILCFLSLITACQSIPDCALVEMSGKKQSQVFNSDREMLAYAYGLDRGQGLVRRYRYLKELGIDLDMALTRQGFLHAITEIDDGGKTSQPARLSVEQIKRVIYDFDREVAAIEQNLARLESSRQLRQGSLYLRENASSPDVVMLESGLQYRVLRRGSGAGVDDRGSVVVHYRGRLIDGTEFDSSYSIKGQPIKGQPRTFSLNGVIAGWREALKLMRVGDKWELTLPPSLGYGASRYGAVPANAVLVFELELLEVK